MLLFHREVFDEVIVGTATTWYTSDDYNGLIGAADDLVVFAVGTDIVGTATALNVYVDTSADNEHWNLAGTAKIPAIPGATLTTNPVQAASVRMSSSEALASFARLRITLTGGGTTGACRLKLTVTGRSG